MKLTYEEAREKYGALAEEHLNLQYYKEAMDEAEANGDDEAFDRANRAHYETYKFIRECG